MRIKVLIADDHELVRIGLQSILEESSGIEVVGEAIDGATAVAAAIECTPDVILMDLRMPRMDGIAATAEIKSIRPETRVLIITSNDNQEDMFAALSAGADGYCSKDIQRQQLILAIQTVHSGATWLDPQIARLVLKTATQPVHAGKSSTSTKGAASTLSSRELEVVQLLVEGLSNNEMAGRLFISNETVKTHMRHIMEKLAVSDRTQAAVKVLRDGLV